MSVEKKVVPAKSIKKILISQARPESEKSPYFDLEKKHKVSLHFHPLIQLVPIPSKEFRKFKIDIATFTAVVFTSKNAIDHFFRICEEMKLISKYVLESKDVDRDKVANILIGMAELYQMKFEECFNNFEQTLQYFHSKIRESKTETFQEIEERHEF